MDKPTAAAPTRARLTVRNAVAADAEAIRELSTAVYGIDNALSVDQIVGQINNFPAGQFIALYDGKVVGHCATMIVPERLAMRDHNWEEITGNGFGSRHDEGGTLLYGFEIAVHPDYRRLRIGQRFYRARAELCERRRLDGIVFGGRMPGYARRKRKYGTPEAYLGAVLEKQVNDQVVNFQLKQGFEPVRILHRYLPEDKDSRGHAVLMLWKNPLVQSEVGEKSARQRAKEGPKPTLPDTVRVATVQFQMRKIESEQEFEAHVRYFVDVASDYRADFVVFPELVTLQLLSIGEEVLAPEKAVEAISDYTERFVEVMSEMAVSYNINIIGGSHPTRVGEEIRNVCYVFLRDGSVHAQEKLHPTPSERAWWNIKGGEAAQVIQTDCGPIGVMICYDSEFPEMARHLVDQGALILFVPFCTDERRGYLRVRYCCHARAIENQCYVAMSGVVGNLPNVENMDVHYAESAILTPSDFQFARDGVAADTAPNTETIAIADLSLTALLQSRHSGTAQNFKDRRYDLYSVNWKRRAAKTSRKDRTPVAPATGEVTGG